MKINGSHVLITGGSQGIGVDIAREFARRGGNVSVLGRNLERLESVATELNGNAIQLDLENDTAVLDAIGTVEARHGGIDILVNNAGLALVRSAVNYKPGDAKQIMTVNAVAPMELIRQVLPRMIARGRGHIVNVSSLAGVAAVPDLAIYGAGKAALHHYTAVVQRELAHNRAPIQMTLVTLGEVAGTQMMEDSRQSPVIAAVSERLAKTRTMPDLSPTTVAVAVADAVERNARYATIPKRISPLIALRNLPSRLQDLALMGLKSEESQT
jgi:short-subunit dehydrogenase